MLNFAYSQSNYRIPFQDKNIEIPENISTFEWNQMPEKAKFNEGYFGWVQFYETPNQTIQDELKNSNIKLLDYIANRTYLFYSPINTTVDYLKSRGARGIIPVDASYKISKELNHSAFEPWAMDGNNLKITLQFYKIVPLEVVKKELSKILV